MWPIDSTPKPAVIDEASSPVAFFPAGRASERPRPRFCGFKKWRLAVTGVIPGELLRGWAVAKERKKLWLLHTYSNFDSREARSLGLRADMLIFFFSFLFF